MPSKIYQQGRAFEYSVLSKLKALGFDGMRSAGSHGVADLLVWKEVSKIFQGTYPYDDRTYEEQVLKLYMIQCKHSLTKDASFETLFKEENVIKLAAMPSEFTKVLCIKQPRSRNIIQLYYDGTMWKLKNIFDI